MQPLNLKQQKCYIKQKTKGNKNIYILTKLLFNNGSKRTDHNTHGFLRVAHLLFFFYPFFFFVAMHGNL